MALQVRAWFNNPTGQVLSLSAFTCFVNLSQFFNLWVSQFSLLSRADDNNSNCVTEFWGGLNEMMHVMRLAEGCME